MTNPNPKAAVGAEKPALNLIPRAALEDIAAALADGARKYGAFNYRGVDVRASTYYAAALRHLTAWFDGEDNAEDSGLSHLGHAMASLAILSDMIRLGRLTDDRPLSSGP